MWVGLGVGPEAASHPAPLAARRRQSVSCVWLPSSLQAVHRAVVSTAPFVPGSVHSPLLTQQLGNTLGRDLLHPQITEVLKDSLLAARQTTEQTHSQWTRLLPSLRGIHLHYHISNPPPTSTPTPTSHSHFHPSLPLPLPPLPPSHFHSHPSLPLPLPPLPPTSTSPFPHTSLSLSSQAL